MALTKPILFEATAFDVQDGYTFRYNVISGEQPTGATIYIFNNISGSLVYQYSVTSFRFEITIPSNSGLVNGVYYSAYITTKNAGGDESPQSNTIQFYCYTNPTWVFTNVSTGSIVEGSTFAPEISYQQIEDEPLMSYIINLYDTEQIQIATSGTKYTSSTTGSFIGSYTFGGFEDATSYYVKAIGQTLGGTILETEMILFTIRYVSPETYSQFIVTNNCDGGYITYTSNVVLIDGKSNPSPPTYIDNELVDLKQEDSWVVWDDGFQVSDNYTLKAWIKNPNIGRPLIKLTNPNGEFVEVYIYTDPNDEDKVFVELLVDNGKYVINTLPDSINKPTSTDELCIQIRCIDNIYQILMEGYE